MENINFILVEATRQQLLNKSKKADNYKDTSKGRNRWERRNKSRIATTVAQYNNINMDDFFKKDILTVGIQVFGETSNYVVTMKFDGALQEIAKQIRLNQKGKLEFKFILQSLIRMFNSDNVYIRCTCPDNKYRMAYHQTRNNYIVGQPENRPSNKTNPNDTKGAGCKHILLVLGNLDWLMKVASVINNYIHYCEDHMERNYADYIFPKLYGMPYNKAVQLGLFDNENGDLDTDSDTIDISNRYGRTRTQFKPGNPWRFQKKPKEQDNKLDLDFNDDNKNNNTTNLHINDQNNDDELDSE